MALSAFEALQEIRKKSDTSTPSGSKPTEVSLASSGRKSAFDALQEIRGTKAPEKAPTPSKAVAPAIPLVAKPKNSSEVMGEITLPASAPAASDASLNLVGGLIMETARKIRDTAPTRPERRLASVGLNFLETVKDLAVTKPEAVLQAESPRRAVLPLIDYGVNMATLGGVDFFMGAAPAVVGAVSQPIAKIWDPTGNAGETSDKVEQAVQWGMDKLFRDIIAEGAGGLAVKGLEAVGLDLNEAEELALKSVLTVGVVMAGFKAKSAVEGKVRPSIVKSADIVLPMADTLGIELKPDGKGGWLMPDEATILKAHKDTLLRQASESTPYTKAKMDAADVAREMLIDYRNLSSGAFEAKWREPVAHGTKLAEQMETTVKEKTAEAEVVKEAEIINEVLNTPATRATRRRVNDLSEAGQFAFEQELVEMAGKNDPKLEKKASEAGHSYERKIVPDKVDDRRPGFYDAETGKIVLHENIIRETLDKVWEGNVLRLGAGKTTTVFRKIEGETFEALKNRYESVLIDHEIAHAKTITPEDVARIKAAKAAGDAKALERIRTEMEDKANVYAFERGNDLDSKTNTEIDRAVERINEGLRVRESINELKFDDAKKEADYRAFRAETRKGKTPDGPDEFKTRLQSERRVLDQYKKAREAQQKVLPKSGQSVAVKRAVNAELRSLKKADKLEQIVSKKDTKILRERISRRLEKQVLRQKAKEAQEKIRNVGKDKAAAQQALVDYMRSSGVPMEVRGRFAAQLKNAKTQGDATRIITEINRDWNKYKRQETASAIKKTLKTALKNVKKGTPRGKLTAEARSELKKIQRYTKMDRNTVNQKILQLEAEARAKMAEDARKNGTEPGLYLPDDVARQIELLEMGGIKEQTLPQLERTLSLIQEIASEGKSKRAEYLAREKDYTERFIATASKDLIGTETRPKEAGSFVAGKDMGVLGQIRRFLNPKRVFGDLVSDLGGVFRNEGSRLSEAVNRSEAKTKTFLKETESIMEGIYGADWESKGAVMATKVEDLGSLPDANGKPVKLAVTRANAIWYYMKMREAGGMEALTDPKGGTAFTPDILTKITDVLTPEDIKLADKLQKELYPEVYKELAPVFAEKEGRPLGDVNMYAGTQRYEQGQTVGGEMLFDIGKSLDEAGRDARMSKTPGYTEMRTKARGQMKPSSNPVLDYVLYRERAIHYIEVGQKVQRWRSLLADSGIRKSIIETRGESFLDTLNWQIDQFERGSLNPDIPDSASRQMQALFSNVTTAILASPKVWAGQFSAPAGFRAYASTLPGKTSDFWRGMKDSANVAEMMEYSAVAQSRGLASVAELKAKFEGDRTILERFSAGAKKLQGIPLEAADRIATRRSAAGIYLMQKNHYLRQGMSLEQSKRLAGRDASEAIDRTQSSTSPTGKSQQEAGKLGFLAPLSQQPKKIANGNIEAYKLLRQGRITTKQYADFLLWNNVIQAGLYASLRIPVAFGLATAAGGFYQAIGQYELADKEKEKAAGLFKPENLGKEVTFGSLMNLTSFPIIGGVVSTGVQNLAGGTNYEFRPTLLQAITEDLLDSATKIRDGNGVGGILNSARAASRMTGVGDPLGLMKIFIKAQNESYKEKEKERKKLEAATPAGRRAAQEKAKAAKAEKAEKEARIRAMKNK